MHRARPQEATAKRARLYRMVTPDHVCPYGIKSKDLLERKGFEVDDHPLRSRDETEAFKEAHGVETTPQTFVDGDRVGGLDDLRVWLGKDDAVEDEDETTYEPVLATFSMTALMALAAAWAFEGTVSTMRTVELFIAFSMCVLAVFKLRDLEGFTNRFITYDVLGRRVVRYAYVYPFAEAIAGLGMIAMVFVPGVAAVALFIGSIGAFSVIKAVYVDGRDLKCACVGGDADVPLGAISLTENVMMVAMAIWMLTRWSLAL